MGFMHRRFDGFGERGVALVTLLIALLLLTLAVPRVLVAFASLPAASAIFAIERGADLTVDDLLGAERALQRATAYGVDTANVNGQLSYLTLYRLTRAPITTEVRAELMDVREQVETALQRRPLDAYLWTRYTHVSYLLDGLSPYTLAALHRSFQYGSDEMELFKFRLILSVQEWDNLPSSLRKMVREQIAFASDQQRLWPRLLANMDEKQGQQLLLLLEEANFDVERIERATARQRRRQSKGNSGSSAAE